jgi:teichuronic acid exporter
MRVRRCPGKRLDHDVRPLLVAQTPDPAQAKLVVGNAEHTARRRSIERSARGCERIGNDVQARAIDSRGKLAGHLRRYGNHPVEPFQRAQLQFFIEPKLPISAGKSVERGDGGQTGAPPKRTGQEIGAISVRMYDVGRIGREGRSNLAPLPQIGATGCDHRRDRDSGIPQGFHYTRRDPDSVERGDHVYQMASVPLPQGKKANDALQPPNVGGRDRMDDPEWGCHVLPFLSKKRAPLGHTLAQANRVTKTQQSSLDRSLIHGVAWTAGMKWATQIVSWASTLVIVRLLSPGDYGLYGMALLYTGFVAPIYDLGVSAAIVQRHDLTDEKIARLGGLSLIYGLGFSLLSLVLAPVIAAFYKEPVVARIIEFLSIAYLITAPQMLPRALMARRLEFKKLAWVDGVQSLSITISTIVFAILGYRYWSLAYAAFISAVVTTVLTVAWAPHRIAWPSQFRQIAGEAKFGWNVALSRVGTYTYSNADFAIVGRVLGKAALGAYEFGWTLATLPVDRVSSLVARVIPSVLSRVQHDKAGLRRYCLGLSEGLAFVALPLAAGMALTADHFVMLAAGPKWTAAIAPLRLLAFYGGFRAIATVISPVLVATGHAMSDLKYTIFSIAVLAPLFYLGSHWGTGGVAAAWIAGFPIASFPSYRAVFRLIDLNARTYLGALMPPLVASGIMALAVVAVRMILPETIPLAARFAAEVVVGVLTYLAVIRLRYWSRIQTFIALVRGAAESGDGGGPGPDPGIVIQPESGMAPV